MGHIEYFMSYRNQPTVFKSGANSAFHEAIGDTVALSVVTIKHLKKIGLIEDDKTTKSFFCVYFKPAISSKFHVLNFYQDATINFLMKTALLKISFAPFGYLIDKWRWHVFRGAIQPVDYNKAWWKLMFDFFLFELLKLH
jgi:peptidyl-dipeptidase A